MTKPDDKPTKSDPLEALAARWTAEAGHLEASGHASYCDALRACAAELIEALEAKKGKP